MFFDAAASDSPISKRMREREKCRGKRTERSIKQREWAEAKAGLGRAVVINMLRQIKGPGAYRYMIIKLHTAKIIFLSQFSWHDSHFSPVSLLFCRLLYYDNLILFDILHPTELLFLMLFTSTTASHQLSFGWHQL